MTRRAAAARPQPMGMLNEGIAGNRVLSEGIGPSALARFDRDVLAQSGVTHVVLLEGINDLGLAGAGQPMPTAAEIIAGHQQIVERAHAHGLKVIAGTFLPFEGTNLAVVPGYYSVEKDALRQAVNELIRKSRAYDGVIDFEMAIRDPGHPLQVLPRFKGADNLHLTDAGYQAMADAVNLALLATVSQRAAFRPANGIIYEIFHLRPARHARRRFGRRAIAGHGLRGLAGSSSRQRPDRDDGQEELDGRRGDHPERRLHGRRPWRIGAPEPLHEDDQPAGPNGRAGPHRQPQPHRPARASAGPRHEARDRGVHRRRPVADQSPREDGSRRRVHHGDGRLELRAVRREAMPTLAELDAADADHPVILVPLVHRTRGGQHERPKRSLRARASRSATRARSRSTRRRSPR